jgi:hypothetical protein
MRSANRCFDIAKMRVLNQLKRKPPLTPAYGTAACCAGNVPSCVGGPRLTPSAEHHVGVDVNHDIVRRGGETKVVRIDRRSAQILRRDWPSPKELLGDTPHRVSAVIDVHGANVGMFRTAIANQRGQRGAPLVPSLAKMPVPYSMEVRNQQKLVDLSTPLPQLMRQRMPRVRKVGRSKIDLERDTGRHERKLPW